MTTLKLIYHERSHYQKGKHDFYFHQKLVEWKFLAKILLMLLLKLKMKNKKEITGVKSNMANPLRKIKKYCNLKKISRYSWCL
jgi:hypothetical protein